MRTLGALSQPGLKAALRHGGLRIAVGPYVYCIRSELPIVQRGLETLYRDFPLAEEQGFADYNIALRASSLVHRLRRKTDFYLDDQIPFNRIENEHGYAFLEWGMNWCVSVSANEYLKLHSSVVAKDGVALIMPGLPGAGKSTLCAALALTGWQVLSDEHALVLLDAPQVVPLYRPVSLKNESIGVIRDFAPDAEFGPMTEDTHKGTVAHMKADLHPASHTCTPIDARLMIFPQFQSGSPVMIKRRSRAESFMFAAHHSFNYSLLSEAGFRSMGRLLDAVDCYDLRYSQLDGALEFINELHAEVSAR